MLGLGKETKVRALGKEWTFGRLELALIESYRDWIAGQVGDPFATAERLLAHMPPGEAMRLVGEAEGVARQLRCFSLGCPLAQEYLATERGMGHLAYLLLKAAHSDIDPDTAFRVALEVGAAKVAEAARRGTGEVPGAVKNEPAPADPKMALLP